MKPEDVSQEALAQAQALFVDWEGPSAEEIARAIMAAKAEEREACAIIAEMHEHQGVIAAAIRKRGETA